jgi:hypothetical protein
MAAEGFVDVLEAIDVEDDDRQRALATGGELQVARQPLQEESAIGKAG